MNKKFDNFFDVTKNITNYQKKYTSLRNLLGQSVDGLAIYQLQKRIDKVQKSISFLKKLQASKITGENSICCVLIIVTSVLFYYAFSAKTGYATFLLMLTFAGLIWGLHLIYTNIIFRRCNFYHEAQQIDDLIIALEEHQDKLENRLRKQENRFIVRADDAIAAIEETLMNIRPDIDPRVLAEIAHMARERAKTLEKKYPLNLYE